MMRDNVKPHIWDVLGDMDKEDIEAMQEAYKLAHDLEHELFRISELLDLEKKRFKELWEKSAMLSNIISHWWEIYIEKFISKSKRKTKGMERGRNGGKIRIENWR